MIITPSGGSPDGVNEPGMAEVTLDGAPLNDATPSSEWEMHAAIYRAFPAAACVVHTHADACTALASLNRELPPFHYMVVQFGGAERPLCAIRHFRHTGARRACREGVKGAQRLSVGEPRHDRLRAATR